MPAVGQHLFDDLRARSTALLGPLWQRPSGQHGLDAFTEGEQSPVVVEPTFERQPDR